MPNFNYQAKDKSGKSISGIIDAQNASMAAAVLRDQGLFPQKIEASVSSSAVDFVPGSAPPPNLGQPVGAQSKVEAAPFLVSVPLPELAMMYRQFSTLLRSGVPIFQGIGALVQQTQHGRLKRILSDAQQSVAGGAMFSVVMERYPAVFNTMQIELIRAGELGGMLDQMCLRLAEYLEKEVETRRKLQKETLYPKIVLFVAGLVLLILGFVNAGMGASGLAVVKARVGFAIAVTVGGFALWWLGRFLNQFPQIGAIWDSVKMLVPGLGSVSRAYATARFCRALGALYGGGVNIVKAVEISGRACGNRAIGQKMLEGVPVLMSGGGISGMLGQSGLLSPIAVQMARTGEQTGSLDDMMNKVADYLESEADQKSHKYAVIAGVLAMLIAGMVVLIIAVQAYGGYFTGIMKAGDGGGE